MRKFQVNGNTGLTADVLGMYGYYDQQRLAEHIAFINQYMEEKNIAKHFPGVTWQELEMDLTDDFKKALLIKAEIFAKKKAGASDLTWELAKRCAANPEQINQNAIPSIIKDMIAYAKPFANSPFFLELSPSSALSSSSEVKERKKEHEVVEETKVLQETKERAENHEYPLGSEDLKHDFEAEEAMVYHAIQQQSLNSGDMLAFSFAGSSPSVSSSSTLDSLNATHQEENSNTGVSTPNTLTPEQRHAQVRNAWAAKFPASGK